MEPARRSELRGIFPAGRLDDGRVRLIARASDGRILAERHIVLGHDEEEFAALGEILETLDPIG